MGFLERLRPVPVGPVTGIATQNEPTSPPVAVDHEKSAGAQYPSAQSIDSDSDDEVVHKDAQWGVQKAEAMCQGWGKKSLIITYAL